MAGKWKTVKALKTHCWKFFFYVGKGDGRFWGEWLGDETTNEGNIRLQSWGAPPKLSISYKLEYQYCPEKERDSLIPGHIQSFQILTCDWHLENFVAPVTGIAVYSPPFPLSPPEINWFEDPFEKFSPMMLIEVLSTTLPHYHWSFQNIHRYNFHDLKS